ncbi:MAG: nicotinate-nucleotide adenylyltransferase [Candidatus Dactylopiibacterium sp.]|nr:nicotinate-nucleotide adenylyltransferase [Candidatus Dactylopiibacterium sp.]
MTPRRPLGILGGTFDPIHYGHLRMAEEARDALALERVSLIPAGLPPHRERPGTQAADRLEMTRLAAAAHPHLEVDAGEALAAAPSYTVPTLERLRDTHGTARPLVLLLGMDAFQNLAGWHRWRELFALAHIAVATRPGYDFRAAGLAPELGAELRTRFTPEAGALAASPAGRVTAFAMTPLAISATAIREQIARGASPRFLLPDAVLDYIQTHHLYTY